jgi:hypothetical protein
MKIYKISDDPKNPRSFSYEGSGFQIYIYISPPGHVHANCQDFDIFRHTKGPETDSDFEFGLWFGSLNHEFKIEDIPEWAK